MTSRRYVLQLDTRAFGSRAERLRWFDEFLTLDLWALPSARLLVLRREALEFLAGDGSGWVEIDPVGDLDAGGMLPRVDLLVRLQAGLRDGVRTWDGPSARFGAMFVSAAAAVQATRRS